jgi:hypothetical protein
MQKGLDEINHGPRLGLTEPGDTRWRGKHVNRVKIGSIGELIKYIKVHISVCLRWCPFQDSVPVPVLLAVIVPAHTDLLSPFSQSVSMSVGVLLRPLSFLTYTCTSTYKNFRKGRRESTIVISVAEGFQSRRKTSSEHDGGQQPDERADSPEKQSMMVVKRPVVLCMKID